MKLSRKYFLRMMGTSLFIGAVGKLAGMLKAAVRVPRRWGMSIDLPRCFEAEGCSKCIEACHRTHNVPVLTDPAHTVDWIWKDSFEHAFPSQQSEYPSVALKDRPVLVFCNHCDNPPCVRVCPTRATWKREDGIVMMDFHRCIGCRYCMAACPYGSRGFNWMDPKPHIPAPNPDFPTRTKGVVEKCNFCEERLVRGLMPACVEACPQKAMAFGDLNDEGSNIRRLLGSRYSIRRKPELGTKPEIFYLV